MGRTDRASRLIRATPDTIYAALVDGDAVAQWRRPSGMTGRMEAFDPRAGGRYRMRLIYDDPADAGRAKSGEGADVVEGRFVELVPGVKVVEEAVFESDDPAFSGVMTVTTRLTPVEGGTEVAFVCENVPRGISAADHAVGINSTLENLAAFVE